MNPEDAKAPTLKTAPFPNARSAKPVLSTTAPSKRGSIRMPSPRQDAYRLFHLHLARVGLAAVLLVIAFGALAADSGAGPGSPDWLQLGLGLFGGLALFLAGLDMLSEGMTKAAGDTLKTVLCARRYLAYEGLFDVVFKAALLGKEHAGFESALVMSAFEFDNATRLARRHLDGIRWTE